MQTDAPEIRSIEDSIGQAHDAAYRASHLTSLILDDLNGMPSDSGSAAIASLPQGLVYSADHLAGRLESLCHDLERVRGRLVSNNPKSMAVNNARQQTGGAQEYTARG